MRHFGPVTLRRSFRGGLSLAPRFAGACAAILLPVVAMARRSSGSSYSGGDDGTQVVVGILGVVVFLAIFALWAKSKSKVSVTRADGTVETPSAETTPTRKAPPHALVGRSTTEFGFIEDRNRRVLALKQKYGNAVRIVARAKTGYGYNEKYLLVTEIPAKCPRCKEAFSVDSWGLLDCPGCGEHLAVIFENQKKMVYVVTGVNDDGTFTVAAPKSPTRASRPKPAHSQALETPPKAQTSEPHPDEVGNGIAGRFSRINPKT